MAISINSHGEGGIASPSLMISIATPNHHGGADDLSDFGHREPDAFEF